MTSFIKRVGRAGKTVLRNRMSVIITECSARALLGGWVFNVRCRKKYPAHFDK